jgi:hypothetical protein
MSALPTMTRRELSWHETIAAMRARKEAEAAGCPPDSRHALAISAAAEGGNLVVGGVGVPAVTLGTLWAIEEGEAHLEILTGGKRYADLSLLAVTLLQPEETLLHLLAGEVADVQEDMLAMAGLLTPDQAVALDRFFGEEMRRMRAITGDAAAAETPGKSVVAPSP